MKILKFIWDVIQCFIVGIIFIGILFTISAICFIGFAYILDNIPQIISQIIIYIILVLILAVILLSFIGLGNEILRKF